jgi:hypothetical protein
MEPNEVIAHAHRISLDYLDDGIEFCFVYEDDQLCDVAGADQEKIWNFANNLLRAAGNALPLLTVASNV